MKKTKKKIALILGVTGQDGIILSKILIKKKYEIHGIARSKYKYYKLKKNYLKNINFYKLNICETKKIIQLINKIGPDEIYNFAGISDLKNSERDKEFTLKVNFTYVKNILDNIYNKDSKIKFFQSLSSEMFEINSLSNMNVISEKSRFKANNFYSLSKIKLYKYIINLRKKKNALIYCGFLFNHDSLHRDKRFIIKKISNHLKKKIINNPMKIKNIYYRKDISHADNIVEGIYNLMQNKIIYDVVIGSGKFISIKEIINLFTKKLAINSKWIRNRNKIYLINQKNKNILFYSQFKKKSNSVLVASTKILQKISNWKPQSNIKKIINELV